MPKATCWMRFCGVCRGENELFHIVCLKAQLKPSKNVNLCKLILVEFVAGKMNFFK